MELQSARELPIAWPAPEEATWINGRGWDLRWLIGSAIVVPLVLALVWAGTSATLINVGITALVGGPHLFSTYTATYLDPRFRRSHRLGLLAVSVFVPAFVVFWTFYDFQILMSVFIFAASLHVLQQNAYLSDVYRQRARRAEPAWSRLSDYAVLMLAFYPAAAYKLVNGNFTLGDVRILIPRFLLVPAMYWAVWFAFGMALVVWLTKTVQEARRGELNKPKTTLIGATVGIAFFVPMLEDTGRLELVFQAVNAWHSIQYLGIIVLVHELRRRQGLIGSPAVAWMAGRRRRIYGVCFVTSAVLMGAVTLVAKANPFGLSFNQYYFMFMLSALLIHYVLDAYLFGFSLRRGSDLPLSVPATAPGVLAQPIPAT